MATPVLSDQDFGGTSRILGHSATPGRVVANGTQALGAAEVSLLSVGITLAPNTSGRIEILAALHITMGTVLLGSNGGELRVYVDGVLDPDATTQKQITAALAVAITFDSEPVMVLSERTGLAAGSHTVEVRGVKLGAVSTTSVTGRRTLAVKQLNL